MIVVAGIYGWVGEGTGMFTKKLLLYRDSTTVLTRDWGHKEHS